MFEVRDGLYYTKDHEWIQVDGKKARFGIADYAQHEMGDLVSDPFRRKLEAEIG